VKTSLYWVDSYLVKRLKASEAIKKIRSGQRIFIGSACGESQDFCHVSDPAGFKVNRIRFLVLTGLSSQP
jgi:hypothetical protein